MAIAQSIATARLERLGEIGRMIEGISGEIDHLVQDGAASPDEAAAFETCIEELWVRMAGLQRSLYRGCDGPCGNAGRRTDILTLIRMLQCDAAFARQRLTE